MMRWDGVGCLPFSCFVLALVSLLSLCISKRPNKILYPVYVPGDRLMVFQRDWFTRGGCSSVGFQGCCLRPVACIQVAREASVGNDRNERVVVLLHLQLVS